MAVSALGAEIPGSSDTQWSSIVIGALQQDTALLVLPNDTSCSRSFLPPVYR